MTVYKSIDENPYLNDTLCHHGILGMKWGIRRYQNKDGSLTPAGKKHYGTKNNSEVKLKDDLSNLKEYNNNLLKTLGYDLAKSSGIKPESLNFDNLASSSFRNKYENDKNFKRKWDKIADLGLKARNKIGLDKNERIGDGSRQWFLFEDQTFGQPQLAKLISDGYSSKSVKKFANLCSKQDLDEINGNLGAISVFGLDEEVNAYVDACERIRDSNKNKSVKHTDIRM